MHTVCSWDGVVFLGWCGVPGMVCVESGCVARWLVADVGGVAGHRLTGGLCVRMNYAASWGKERLERMH